MANFLAPDPLQSTFFIPGSNTPGNGVKLFTYLAGSSTKTTVYKTQAGTAHTNPIVLDSGGNLPSQSQLWIPTGVTIKAVYAPSNDSDPPASPYLTIDNLSGINDILATASEWVSGPTPTFVSGTQLTVVGDQTSILHNGRRVQTNNTGGTVYSTITSSVFASTTALGLRNDAGTLDSGLSALLYGLLDSVNPSVPLLTDFYPIARSSSNVSGTLRLGMNNVTSEIVGRIPSYGFNVATQNNATSTLVAGSTTNASSVTGDAIVLTGTTAINQFRLFDGQRLEVQAAGTTPINNSTTLPLISGANITTAAGDWFVLRGTASSTVMESYQFKGSQAALGASMVLLAEYTAVSSASFQVTTNISSAFTMYELHMQNLVPTNNAVDIDVQVTVDGGATYVTSATYEYELTIFPSNTTSTQDRSASATGIVLTRVNDLANNVNGGGLSGKVSLYNPSNNTHFKYFTSDGIYNQNTAVVMARTVGGGRYNSTAAINGFRIVPSAGTIATGSAKLYGIKG